MVCTEFIGGVRNGTLGQRSDPRERFKQGTRLLGSIYQQGEEELWALRCGLLHSYLPEGKRGRDYVFANDPRSTTGFKQAVDPNTARETLTVNAPAWLGDLRSAYRQLMDELENNSAAARAADAALDKLPGLA